jgi:hypothetical protein
MITFKTSTTAIKTAFVKDETASEGRIPVVVQSNVDSVDGPIEDTIWVHLSSPTGMPLTIPKKGTKGLVLFDDIDIRQADGYWVGAIHDRFDLNQHKPLTISTPQFESPSKQNRIAVNDAITGIFSKNNAISLNEEELRATFNNNQLIINDNYIKLEYTDKKYGSPQSYLHLSPTKAELSTTGTLILHSGGNYEFRTDRGFSVTGSKDPNSKNSGEESFASCDHFFVKSSKVTFNNTNGPMNFSGGTMDIKLAGGKLSGGGGAPGSGPSYSYSMRVIDGPVLLETGSGNLELRASNKLMKDKIMITCGSNISVMKSYIEMGSSKLLIQHQQAPGTTSQIEFGSMNATLKAFKDIIMEATTGKISAKATTNLELEAMIDAKIKALKLAIEAQVEVSIKAAILKLKDCNMIDAGPKVVPPKGAGPFCAIPICPLTGVNHTGDIAIG